MSRTIHIHDPTTVNQPIITMLLHTYTTYSATQPILIRMPGVLLPAHPIYKRNY